MTFKKYIAGLLLICFSVFLGHNLVPHHHHSEVFHTPISSACPIEHGDTHEHDHDADSNEHPTHCHAFNDVVFQKYNAPALRPNAGTVQSMMVPGQTKLLEEEQHASTHIFAFLKLPCKKAIYLGSRDLRAPPVFA